MSIVELKAAIFQVAAILAAAAAFGNMMFLIISASTEEAINSAMRKLTVNLSITAISILTIIIGI